METLRGARVGLETIDGRTLVKPGIALTATVLSVLSILGFGVVTVRATATLRVQTGSDVTLQSIQYPSVDASIEAYIARPTTAGPHPAVILVHDDQGLNEVMRETSRLFAAAGFVTLAPNLLSRVAKMSEPIAAPTSAQASQIRQLPLNQTAEDVRAAFTFLQKDSTVTASKISVVGFGWGGWRAFKLAEQVPTLYRAVVFYGTTSDDEQLHRIRSPVLGHYAEYDFQTTGNVLATKRRLGRGFTYYIYPDTDRGFFGGSNGPIDYTALVRGRAEDPSRRASDRPQVAIAQAAARQAWERTLAFLRASN